MEIPELFRQFGVYLFYGWLACFPLFVITMFIGRFLDSSSMIGLGKLFLKVFFGGTVILILISIIFFNGLEEMQKMGGILVDKSQVNIQIYENRSMGSRILGYTQRFDGITIQEQDGEWAHINTTSGVKGWIKKSDLQGLPFALRVKHMLNLSVRVLKDMFSLHMAKDILIGIVISLTLMWIFGKVRGEFIDERLGLIISATAVSIAVFVDYDFRTYQGFVEGTGVVGARLFLSGFAGLVSASLLEMVFSRDRKEIGCVGLVFGTLSLFLLILYYSYIAFG